MNTSQYTNTAAGTRHHAAEILAEWAAKAAAS
jgi:hypothetical protein